jgi:XTP/dITP diphosphohydrolase
MDIVFASNNKHKLSEVRNILDKYNILSLEQIGFNAEIEENGKTIEENAFIKVRTIRAYTDKIIIADDTGLFVKALNGEPGVYSARYAGENATFADNNKKLLKALEGKKNRQAVFKCAVALNMPNGEEKIFIGEVQGSIAAKASGDSGFGYDPIFIFDKLNTTYAQMSIEQKDLLSHRAKALFKLAQFIESLK